MKTRFRLNAIINNIPYRPKGYYEEVISAGSIIEDYLELDVEEARKLIEKYRDKNPANGKLNDTTKWGPILWTELHSRAASYAMDQTAEERWLKIFTTWVPCGKCKRHWKELTTENPADLSSPKAYREWAVRIHNEVNKSLGKPIYEPSS
jgi:FAD-linked sulfhydryl oxidase